MNQQASPAPEGPVPPVPTPEAVAEDVAAALRLPGPLGRPREGLPVARCAPMIPTALSTFNRLTGRLDQGGPPAGEEDGGGVVTELSGAPVEAVRATRRDRPG
ncbi:MAG: hypothetical protein ACREQ5_22155 [Candidatus Dormibacteria bacterium]